MWGSVLEVFLNVCTDMKRNVKNSNVVCISSSSKGKQYLFLLKNGISAKMQLDITRFDGEGGEERRLLYVSPIDPSPYLTSHTITLLLITDQDR